MSQVAMYMVLRDLGVDDAKAQAAVDAADLVTRDFFKAELAEMEGRIIKWNVGVIIAMTALFAGIVKLS